MYFGNSKRTTQIYHSFNSSLLPIWFSCAWIILILFNYTVTSAHENSPLKNVTSSEFSETKSKCFIVGRNPADPYNLNLWNSRSFCELGPVCYVEKSPKHWMIFENENSSASSCELFHCFTGGIDNGVSGCIQVTTGNGYSAVSTNFGRTGNDATALCRNARSNLIFSIYKSVSLVNSSWLALHANRTKWDAKKNFTYFVMPRYYWMHNLYHAARPFLFYLNVFYGSKRYGIDSKEHWKILALNPHAKHHQWLKSFRKAIRFRGVPFGVQHLEGKYGDQYACFEKVLMMGKDGYGDSMLFVNDSDLLTIQHWSRNEDIFDYEPHVSHESLIVKEFIRLYLGFKSILLSGDILNKSPKYVIDSPQLNFAFVDRLDSSRTIANVEKFLSLLQKLCHELGFKFQKVIFDTPEGPPLPFTKQVELMFELGAIAGVHGANFVNAIFMPPFAFMLEIFPFRYRPRFYIGASNSGLYYQYHSSSLPTGDKAYSQTCDVENDMKCQNYLRSVSIELIEKDYTLITEKLRLGMNYIKQNYQKKSLTISLKGSTYRLTT